MNATNPSLEVRFRMEYVDETMKSWATWRNCLEPRKISVDSGSNEQLIMLMVFTRKHGDFPGLSF